MTTDVAGWCRAHLGAEPVDEIFRVTHLSDVVGVRLADGREVVVKVRPAAARLHACFEVHRHVFEAGFPVPEPLVPPTPFGDRVASAECYLAGGDSLPSRGRDPEIAARAFARLMALTPSPDTLSSLAPAPPWVAWDHDEGGLWPRPDDIDIDLNSVDGPQWADEAAAAARARLSRRLPARRVVGHGDWYTENVKWADDELHVVHDWDSAIADTEAAIVGITAAIYPASEPGNEATVDETGAFIEAYADARGRTFTSDEVEVAWAAGLWLRSFDAKKQHARDGEPRSLTKAEASERRALAG